MTHHQREKINVLYRRCFLLGYTLTHKSSTTYTWYKVQKIQKYTQTHLFDVNFVNEENSFVSFSKTHYHYRLILHYYIAHSNE